MPPRTDEKTGAFTEDDRQLLSEIHRILAAIEPYLPMLERASAWMHKNPAVRWRERNRVQ